MGRKWFALFLLFAILCSCGRETGPESDSLRERLEKLPGVVVEAITPAEGFTQAFAIDISQPLDHRNSKGKVFWQRIYLSHRGDDKPMVLVHSGYGVSQNSIYELTRLLDANQILVTHRFFPNARPEPADWPFLTVWQAASDHHRIVDSFKGIYKGKWVCTGASKGGMTALFDRRFNPNDVDATVAYVAPIMFGTEDPRFREFLVEKIGSEEGREKIRRFQRLLLANRGLLMPLVEEDARKRGWTFAIGAEAALEYAVLEYWFAFWQYGDGDESKIPGPAASPSEWYSHLSQVSSLYYYSDTGIAYFEPFFYQAFTELGYGPYLHEHLQDLLTIIHDPTYRTFAPRNVSMEFDPSVMRDIQAWLQSEGSHIIYIYGANDPYTAAAVELTGATNALKIVQSRANHRVKITDLDERDRVFQTLRQWLGVPVTLPASIKENAGVYRQQPPGPDPVADLL